MKCPACGNDLTEIDIGGVFVDICKGHCGGVWFDWNELKKVDEPHEIEGEALLSVERDADLVVDHSLRRDCPRCETSPRIVMMRHFSSFKREAEVDECPKCGGFWLDADELGCIRDAFMTEAKKGVAEDLFTDEYIKKNHGDVINAMRTDGQNKLAFAKKFAHALRFICPSYYIKGKQDGAAF